MRHSPFFFFAVIAACLLSTTRSTPLPNDYDGGFLLFRVKRNANRALTYSGFNPNGVMTAFATSADFPSSSYLYPFGAPPPPQPPLSEIGGPSVHSNSDFFKKPLSVPQSDNFPASTNESPTFIPSKEIGPVEEEKPINFGGSSAADVPPPPAAEFAPSANENEEKPSPATPQKKGKKKPITTEEEDEEEYVPSSGKSSSRSSSSFNAWFPIMLSMYPGGSGIGGLQSPSSENAFKDNAAGHPYTGKERTYGTTIIANSVSNGRSGVAHAIAYGGSSGPLPSSFGVQQQKEAAASSNWR